MKKGKNMKIKATEFFEDEYLNVRKWKGEGEEYDYFGNYIFKRQYLDGKQKGIILDYNYYDSYKLKYEGKYKNGNIF